MPSIKRSASIDVVVAGYLGVDMTPGFPAGRGWVPMAKLFRPGTLIETDGLTISLGGAVANTGLALKRFGRRVELMGCTGDDVLGSLLRQQLDLHGAGTSLREIRGANTAYGIVISPPGTDRVFLEDPGANRLFGSRHIDYDIVSRSRLFHFGYPPLMDAMWASQGDELHRIYARVRSLGVATSLDMALPDPKSPAGKADWQAILKRVLPLVDIFAPSIEETLFMLEPKLHATLVKAAGSAPLVDVIPADVYERLAVRILEFGVKVVMIKAAHHGAYFRTGDVKSLADTLGLRLPVDSWNQRSLWKTSLPVHPRRFVNASGAGDCAVAGLLSALLSGKELYQAAHYAMLAGRDNLHASDAISGLRDWKSMTASVERHSTNSKKGIPSKRGHRVNKLSLQLL